jgi:hypothetical protein
MNWLDKMALYNSEREVKNLGYSIVPKGGDSDTDDYIMVKSLENILSPQTLRSLECSVTTLTTDICTIK